MSIEKQKNLIEWKGGIESKNIYKPKEDMIKNISFNKINKRLDIFKEVNYGKY